MAMSWSRTKAPLLGALTLCAALAGCSDIYFDRREHIVPYAGDAMAANRVTHMVDPWPPSSANRNIVFNGEVMEQAAARYREGRVIPPVNATTSSTAYAKAQATAANAAQSARTSTATSSSAPSGWASKSAPQNQSPAPVPAQQPQFADAPDRGETR
jgi:hypothetical protein